MTLKVAPCGHDAAKYAVENWHYSRILPTGKLVKSGVWEDGKFIGVVIFSRGASPHLGKALELDQTQICELTRVALTDHKAPVSQIVAQAMNYLKTHNPGLRAVISFADPSQGHHGGIYQAGNWIYTGTSGTVTEYFVGGRWRHKKGVWNKLVEQGRQGKDLPIIEGGKPVEWRVAPGKYRYIYPLDKAMRRRVNVLRLPYPNAVEGSEASRDDSVVEGQVRFLQTAPVETPASD